jgi:hypothetical protein
MPLTPETLRALGLIAVYLLDSMSFLRIGEAVIVTRGRALHGISFGSGFELGGAASLPAQPFDAFLAGAAAGLLRVRKKLGLGFGQWLSLSCIGLICLPCAANLARVAAKARCWTVPACRLAQLQLAGVDADTLRAQVREALLRARRYVDEESPEFHGLTEQLRLLEGAQ